MSLFSVWYSIEVFFCWHQIATGGKENRLQLWDVSRPDANPVFAAKNVKPDMLELRVPVWVTDICFPDALSPSTVATVSRYGHIRSGLWAASLLLVPRDTSGAFLVVHAFRQY